MTGWLAIAAYRCVVAGEPSGSVDVQVRRFEAGDADAVRDRLAAEPPCEYQNSDGETVRWDLADVFAVEPFDGGEGGDELIGFIAGAGYLAALAGGPPEEP